MKLITFVSNMRLARALVVAVALTIAPAAWSASFFVSVNFAPPPIPVYDQPICPGPDYLWIPGYWAWGPEGYYWVPGYWALAPFIGALWTPGWWGWSGVAYLWHPGYWSHHVGYYGGINYGFGYFGVGYSGGHWSGDHFAYNSSVTHVNMTRITNVYNQPVRHNDVRISYNGGQGGVRHAPTPQERIADREAHRAPTQAQVQHERIASRNRELFASVNHGSPRIAATPRADFRAANEGRVVHGAASRSAQVDRFRGERGAMQTAPVQSRANRAPPERQARGFEAPGNGPRPQTFRAERASPRESQPQARYFEGSRGRAEMAQPHGPAFEAPRSRPETIQPQARGFEGPRGRPEAPTQAHAFQQPRGGAQPRAERPPERMAHGEPQGPGGRGRREGERHEGG
jgi:hypothetical protein